MNSRLQENTQKRTVRSIITAIIAIVVLLVIILIYGPKLLVYLSSPTGNSSANQNETSSNNSPNYIAPPILNQSVNATNSASVNISGSSPNPNSNIELYVNGQQVNQEQLKNSSSFLFKNVTLQNGTNNINAKASLNNNISSFSNQIQVTYSNSAPSLNLNYPNDGQTFSKDQSPITITGKTDPGVTVTINGFWAIIDSQGNFTYSYTLQSGDNDLKIAAQNQAGNIIQKEIHIKTN